MSIRHNLAQVEAWRKAAAQAQQAVDLLSQASRLLAGLLERHKLQGQKVGIVEWKHVVRTVLTLVCGCALHWQDSSRWWPGAPSVCRSHRAFAPALPCRMLTRRRRPTCAASAAG